ncbi:hypothetical protein [Flavobacterium sp.]|uniref:hypothetical protein n=1 Tax=Flavobacterium sp. TaxID=239 RepID=UPI0026326B60|nr:hypothetical protein [Flavobacterium sp.]
MKVKILVLILSTFYVANAQKNQGIIGESNWFNGWTNFKPKAVVYPAANQIITGDIKENMTLTKNNTYLIVGSVHVASGVVLTIEPGTIIRGDYDTTGTLTVVKGAKLIANGSETDPIIFTSNKPASERKAGDWGGIILMGDAPISRLGGVASSFYEPNPLYSSFGGLNENSDSGVIRYTRIEFAGKKIDNKMALNALTLAGVGNKTKLEYIQISFCSDDSIEVVGGQVDFSNVISYRATDDDFDFSMGIQSTVSNTIAIRNPYCSDNTRSRCFEIDSYDKVENFDALKKKTFVKLNNVTLMNDEENSMGLVKEAISLKTDSFVEVNNCVIAGFSSFIAFDDRYLADDNFKKIKVYNTTVDSCTEVFTNETLNKDQNASNWFMQNEKLFAVTNVGINNLFKNNDVKRKPDFRLK